MTFLLKSSVSFLFTQLQQEHKDVFADGFQSLGVTYKWNNKHASHCDDFTELNSDISLLELHRIIFLLFFLPWTIVKHRKSGHDCLKYIKPLPIQTSLMVDVRGKCVLDRFVLRNLVFSLHCCLFYEFALQSPTSDLLCRRPDSESLALKQGSRLPSVQDFKWRVDVAISTRYKTESCMTLEIILPKTKLISHSA